MGLTAVAPVHASVWQWGKQPQIAPVKFELGDQNPKNMK